MHASDGGPAHERGQEHAPEEGARLAEDRAALLRLVPPGDDVGPEAAHEKHDHQDPATEDDDRGRPVLVHPANEMSNEPLTVKKR